MNRSEIKLAKMVDPSLSVKQIIVNNLTINYAELGQGPSLLLIHGANMGWGQWHPNIAELSKSYAVCAIDLPGAGASSTINFRKVNFQRDFVDVVEAFIHKKKLNNLNIIGHSLGGWIALQLTTRPLVNVNKIILVDALGFTNYRPLRHSLIAIYLFAKLLSITAMKPNKKNMNKFLSDVLHNKTALQESFVEYFYEAVMTEKGRHPFLLINRLTDIFGINKDLLLTKKFPNLTNKVLIISGDKDRLIPYSSAAAGFALIPEAKIHIFKNVGHVPSLEASQEFNNLVLNFLKQ